MKKGCIEVVDIIVIIVCLRDKWRGRAPGQLCRQGAMCPVRGSVAYSRKGFDMNCPVFRNESK